MHKVASLQPPSYRAFSAASSGGGAFSKIRSKSCSISFPLLGRRFFSVKLLPAGLSCPAVLLGGVGGGGTAGGGGGIRLFMPTCVHKATDVAGVVLRDLRRAVDRDQAPVPASLRARNAPPSVSLGHFHTPAERLCVLH